MFMASKQFTSWMCLEQSYARANTMPIIYFPPESVVNMMNFLHFTELQQHYCRNELFLFKLFIT